MNQASGLRGGTRRMSRHAAAALALLSLIAGLATAPLAGRAALPAIQSETICTSPPLVSYEVGGDREPATPVATRAAVATASPAATPVATHEKEQIEQLVRAIGACQNERRARTLTKFVTERFLGDYYAGGGRISVAQFVELARDLPRVPVAIVSVTAISVGADGRATAEVVSTVGRQLFRATWRFVFVPQQPADATGSSPNLGVWLADGVEPLPVEPPAGARTVDVRLDDYSYVPARLRVTGPDIVIAAENRGKEDHELLVLKLADGVTTRDLLTAPGPALPRGVSVIGQATIPAGTEGELVLVGMEKGEYAIVDLLLNAEGTPHLALGMEAVLIVR